VKWSVSLNEGEHREDRLAPTPLRGRRVRRLPEAVVMPRAIRDLDALAEPLPARRPRAICGAVRKGKGLCRRRAGEGTDHPGVGRCATHGGNSPAGIKAAAVIVGEGSILSGKTVMGVPVEMDPADALCKCVALAAGEVAYCTAKVQALDHADMIETDHRGRRQMHLWIRERRKCMDRLARFAKMALDAGVAEREIALAEAQAEMVASVLTAVMDEVGLTEKQRERLQEVLPRHLYALEGARTPG
jgi:hypothetical protein